MPHGNDKPINQKVTPIQFLNVAQAAGRLEGTLWIGNAQERTDIKEYSLHWGTSATEKISLDNPIDTFIADVGTADEPVYRFTQPLRHEFEQTSIPAEATHFLVFIKDIAHADEDVLYASQMLFNQAHLLPSNATVLERSLANASARLSRVPVLLKTLWDYSRCPQNLLPWLAWSVSTDNWFDNEEDPDAEASERRDIIRLSPFIHQHKGTRKAIQQALASLGVDVTIIEWWENEPPLEPHTFKLELLVNSNVGANDQALEVKLRQAIDAAKPVRSHYTYNIRTVLMVYMRFAASSEVVSYVRFNMAARVG